jgi:hypothetical protein
MTNLRFDINTAERELADGYVFKVEYFASIADADTGIHVHELSSVSLPRTQDMIPFELLDNTTLVSWVKASLGVQSLTELETRLNSKIQNLKHPRTALELPPL